MKLRHLSVFAVLCAATAPLFAQADTPATRELITPTVESILAES